MWIRSNNLDDVIVNCGNKSTGVWSVTFDLYVPSASTGFWNVQYIGDFTNSGDAQLNGQFFVEVYELTSGPLGVPGGVTTEMDLGLNAVH